MFGKIIFIVLLCGLVLYTGYSVFKIVVAIKENKKRKKEGKEE